MSFEQLLRVLSLQDYNTRVVVIGTTLMGIAGGIVGTFMLLRKRSLFADAVSHATLPGIGIAFMVMVAFGGSGKSLPGLLLGALISGLIGMGAMMFIRKGSRLSDDAALGIVLSVFFGVGVSILGVIQKMKTGSAAGLESFIYGKTASMIMSDALTIGIAAGVIIFIAFLFFKEFSVVCFDAEFAGALGFPVRLIDTVMMSLVVGVTVIGLQAVGLILVIALLIIPSASARFWTERLGNMTFISAGFGAVGGYLGASMSALVPKLPAGAIIVVVSSSFFVLSLVFGSSRGLLRRSVRAVRFAAKVSREHLLRSIFEHIEDAAEETGRIDLGSPVSRSVLDDARSWSSRSLARSIRRAVRDGLIRLRGDGTVRLTAAGALEARKVVRNHRLWEQYLVDYADVATGRVDRGADIVEHVLGEALVGELEERMSERYPSMALTSVHALGHSAADGVTEQQGVN